MQTKRFRCLLAAAVGILSLAGCQLPSPLTSRLSLSTGGQEGASALTASQVADVQIAFGRSLEKRGDAERAVAVYREAIKNDPHRADAYWRLAVLQDQQGKWADSGELYRKALEAQPDNPDLYCDLGYSLYLQARRTEAETNLRQALKLAPDHRRAHNNLALLLAHTGRSEKALAEFRKGGCSEAEAHNNLAFALTLERRWDEARDHYELALAATPSLEAARKGLSDLNRLTAKLAAHVPPAGPGLSPSARKPVISGGEVQQKDAALAAGPSRDPARKGRGELKCLPAKPAAHDPPAGSDLSPSGPEPVIGSGEVRQSAWVTNRPGGPAPTP
jgi:tetratricopeptide (TPR) repeat protein